MLTSPLHCFLNEKHLPHKLHSQPHLPMETTSYGDGSMESFSKAKFWSMSTTYYSTVPITGTQTRIHRTQSLHYDKLLKRSSLRHIVTMNFAAMIYRGDISFCFTRYCCNEVSLERYLGEISRNISMIYRFNIRQSMRCFADISAINRENKTQYSSIIVCTTFTVL